MKAYRKYCHFLIRLGLIILMIGCYNRVGLASLDINGWKWLDRNEKAELWQRKENNYLSESLIYLSVPLNREVLQGYTLITGKTDRAINPDNAVLSFWKVNYIGYDKSGNLYLKIFTSKKNLSLTQIKELKQIIIKINQPGENDQKISQIKSRESFFQSLSNLYQEQGEEMVIEPSRILIIYGLENMPPVKIEMIKTNSVINVKAVKLE